MYPEVVDMLWLNIPGGRYLGWQLHIMWQVLMGVTDIVQYFMAVRRYEIQIIMEFPSFLQLRKTDPGVCF